MNKSLRLLLSFALLGASTGLRPTAASAQVRTAPAAEAAPAPLVPADGPFSQAPPSTARPGGSPLASPLPGLRPLESLSSAFDPRRPARRAAWNADAVAAPTPRLQLQHLGEEARPEQRSLRLGAFDGAPSLRGPAVLLPGLRASEGAQGRSGGGLFRPTETSFVDVPDLGFALSELRRRSHPMTPEVRRIIESVAQHHPELELRADRVFLVKDPGLFEEFDLPAKAAGAARVLRRPLLGGAAALEAPVILLRADEGLPVREFVEFMIHEAVHLEDKGMLKVKHDANLLHYFIEGYTQLRAHDMARESLKRLGVDEDAPNTSYGREVKMVQAFIEVHGRQPLDGLVRERSEEGLRRAFGGRWGGLEALALLERQGGSRRDQLLGVIEQVVRRPEAGLQEIEQAGRELYSFRPPKQLDAAFRGPRFPRLRRLAGTLLPRLPEGENGTLERLKFGFRTGALKAGFMLSALTMASALGWKPHSNYQGPPDPTGLASALGVMVLTVVYGPMVEELLFRVLAYGGLRDIVARRWSRRSAVLIAGALNVAFFVVVHETKDPVLMAVRAVGTMLLVYAYEKGRYLASTVAHGTFNFALLFQQCLVLLLGVGRGMSWVGLAALYAGLLAVAWLHDRRRVRPSRP